MMDTNHSHQRKAIAERLAAGPKPSYLRDFVYGGIDGTITTFAIVAGVVGAELSAKVILILGLANLFADGFSMAASNYSGAKSTLDDIDRIREVEKRHIFEDPDGEKEEVRQLLVRKGIEGEALTEAVDSVTSNEQSWINMMLVEEYGLSLNQPMPIVAALATFVAFLLCGSAPILPFVFDAAQAFNISIIMTGAVFFMIGAVKSKWATAPWWRSGIETFFIGGIAAAMAFTIGHLLKGLG